MRATTVLVVVCSVALACAGREDDASLVDGLQEVETSIQRAAASTGGEVAVYYRDLGSPDSILVAPDLRVHAASTMKVPVMIQLFRDAQEGRISLGDSVAVKTTFTSIVDGSAYELSASSDSEPTLYGRLGGRMTVRELVEPMITRSSNLATNLLIELADAERVTATMRALGADSIAVLRGVEDIPAFEAGLSNTTTARDLGVIMGALARGDAAGPEATAEMIAILERQEFRQKIPAGIPAGVRVANKTGSITRISHDAAIVLPEERPAYVLVVLTRGLEADAAAEVSAEISRTAWEWHRTRHSAVADG